MHLLPPVVGPVIMVIGLSLAPMRSIWQCTRTQEMKGYNLSYLVVALITLLVTIIVQGFFKGFLSLIPVLIGIIVGYIVSIFMGLVNFSNIAKANWIDFPHLFTI